MYNGSNHFGKAYQEELLRTAGVGEDPEIKQFRQSRPRKVGLLHRLLSRLFGSRKEAEPSLPELPQKQQSLMGR
jgi:hypothetical protein